MGWSKSVFKSYYDIANDSPKKNDTFIFFDEDEAFLSCFENGEFVFVKSMTKLSTLSKQLNLSIEESKTILTTKGLNENSYEDENVFSIVESFFSQFFMKVNNLVNYSVSYYGLSKINRIFFYSSFEIENLYESFVSFWDLYYAHLQSHLMFALLLRSLALFLFLIVLNILSFFYSCFTLCFYCLILSL